MYDDDYRIAGKVKIPEDKREEFNGYVLKLLYLSGMRKTETMELGGHRITVVRRAEPDEQGIVAFDYSIFEKKKREVSYYDTNTCEIVTSDRGYGEFGLVINLIMVMQEMYSEEKCYLMCKKEPCKIVAYFLVLRGLLGITPNFPNREKIWEMLLFFKNTEEYCDITYDRLMKIYSFELYELDLDQLIAAYYTELDMVLIPDRPFQGDVSEIRNASTTERGYYLYQKMTEFIERKEGDALIAFLKKVLDADLTERRKLREDRKFGMLAEASLYELPGIIVSAYASAIQQKFWDVWKKLDVRGYTDIIKKDKTDDDEEKEKELGYIPLYRAFQRKSEDEFTEFWDEKELCFSDDMKQCLSDWKEQFDETDIEEDFDMEIFLAELVAELGETRDCRLVDKEFIIEFMEHREDRNYKKALWIYKEFIDGDLWLFPELTREQAKRWMVSQYRDSFEFKAMSAFQSLLINHRHRFELFGF